MIDLAPTIQSDIRSRIHDQLAAHDNELLPCFYAVTGSHLYGTNSASSDIDIKGFHCADGSRYMVFDTPESQLSFETSIPAANSSIEVTSYELKKFGEMLLKSDFSIVELIDSNLDVYVWDQMLLQGIEDILVDMWPTELPVRYLGMAESIYIRDVKEATPTNPSDLKPYVYSLRGCLAAEYVQTHDEVEPRLQLLAEQLLEGENNEQVQQLIAALRGNQLPDWTVLTAVEQLINEKLEAIEASQFDTEHRTNYQDELAEWMLSVRRQTGTR